MASSGSASRWIPPALCHRANPSGKFCKSTKWLGNRKIHLLGNQVLGRSIIRRNIACWERTVVESRQTDCLLVDPCRGCTSAKDFRLRSSRRSLTVYEPRIVFSNAYAFTVLSSGCICEAAGCSFSFRKSRLPWVIWFSFHTFLLYCESLCRATQESSSHPQRTDHIVLCRSLGYQRYIWTQYKLHKGWTERNQD